MARPSIDVFGKRFGKLTVIKRAGSIDRHAVWHCVCDCGNKTILPGTRLMSGKVNSCGCLVRENNRRLRLTHGKTVGGHTRIYRIWNAMKQRCHNPNQPHYPRYGGRGITVCNEWRASFAAFYAAVGEPPTDGHTLDRIDNERGYEPGNCRWATRKEQAQNKRKRV